MADQYLQQLDRVTEAASTDLLPISDDPAGASRLRAIAVGDLVPFRPPAPPSAAAQVARWNPDGSFAGWITTINATGVAGGQTLIGGTAAGDSLTLRSNPHEALGRGTLTLDGPACSLLVSEFTIRNGNQRYHNWLHGAQDYRRAALAIDSWTSSHGNATSTPDTSLTRESAGRLQIGDGGRNASGGLAIRRLNIAGLPTSDPLVEGEVWSDDGDLKISQG